MIRAIFCVLTLACLSFSNMMAQQRGLKVTATDPETGKEVELYQESWALLIGINKYKNVVPLNYAVADAESIRALLVRKFGFKSNRMTVLTDAKATKKGIMDAFATLLNTSPGDRVIVFYAGHGSQMDLPGGGEMGYLIPVDGKTKTKADLYSSCISMEELKNVSRQIPAKHALFLVDACYGGLAAVSTRALPVETKLYIQKIAVAHARQIITAGGRGEVAVEKSEWGHSAFTKALLDGLGKELADLDGNGLVTASELASYLRPRVTVVSDQKQTPQFKAFTDDEGDFMFVLGTRPITIAKPQQPTETVSGESEPAQISTPPQTYMTDVISPLVTDVRIAAFLSLAMGEFGAIGTGTNPGYAKTGFGFGVDFSMDLTKGFGLGLAGSFFSHTTDASSFANDLTQLGAPVGTTAEADSWKLLWLTAGPSFHIPVSSNSRIYGTGSIGLLMGTYPQIKAIDPFQNTANVSTASATNLGYGFSVGFVLEGKFDFGLRLLSAEPEYKVTVTNFSGGKTDVQTKKPTTILNLTLGYRFGL